jgi:hypothetical protein
MGELFGDLENPTHLDREALEGLQRVGNEYERVVELFLGKPKDRAYSQKNGNFQTVRQVIKNLKRYILHQ